MTMFEIVISVFALMLAGHNMNYIKKVLYR